MKRVSIVDYGLGNILSVHRAISDLGFKVNLVNTPEQINSASFLVLPGVGAFNRGMSELNNRGLAEPIRKHIKFGKPLLGICLGMQLLFERSEESIEEKGFGFIPGRVVRVVPNDSQIKVPHIGWSLLKLENNKFPEDTGQSIHDKYVYFVHSYHPEVDSQYLLATTQYQERSINALVKKDNVIGCQFHPEKSGEQGKEILECLLTID